MRGIEDLAKQFVLLRVTNMRGVDLDIFDFDYDLTWAGLFLSADGATLGRYGTRNHEPSEKHRSLKGLRHAMIGALEKNRRPPPRGPLSAGKGKKPEDYASSRRVSAKGCIHCHNVHEFRREEKQQAGTWKSAEAWMYPEPANLGLTLDVDRGDRVLAVTPGSIGAKVGLKAKDTLVSLGGKEVASRADVQYALQHAPWEGSLAISWLREGKNCQDTGELRPGWRKTDLSWRWSLKTLAPPPCVHGEDLSADERKTLRLPPHQLAFRQGAFVHPAARHAGIQINDIITGIDGRRLDMNARQFDIYIRLNSKVGDVVHYNVLRGEEPLKIPLKLPEK